MANPQPENGYVKLANELWDEVIRRDFTKRQKDILFLIWRLSYGCQRRSAYIPKLVYFELAGIGKNHIKNELVYLEKMRVLKWDQEAKLFEVNKDHDEWQVSPVKGFDDLKLSELIRMNLQESSQNGNKKVPETGTKKFPKQELLQEEKNEEFPKQELLSSQNGNYFGEKVPETGTPSTDEPYSPNGFQPPKDIFKDNIKTTTTYIHQSNQDTDKGGSVGGQDFSYSRIYKLYEKHFTSDGRVTEFEVEELGFLYDDYGGEWVLEAMRESVRHKKQTLAYVRGTLKGFKARGGPLKNQDDTKNKDSPGDYTVDDNDPVRQLMRKAAANRHESATAI